MDSFCLATAKEFPILANKARTYLCEVNFSSRPVAKGGGGARGAKPSLMKILPPPPPPLKKLDFFKDFGFYHKIKLNGKPIFLNYFC